MTPALIVKRFDTYPPVSATLTDNNGYINLTSAASVKFIMKGQTTNTVVSGTCTIVNATTGAVQYQWGPTDTSVADTYQVEFEIHWSAGGIQTVPNAQAQDLLIEIDPDLENL